MRASGITYNLNGMCWGISFATGMAIKARETKYFNAILKQLETDIMKKIAAHTPSQIGFLETVSNYYYSQRCHNINFPTPIAGLRRPFLAAEHSLSLSQESIVGCYSVSQLRRLLDLIAEQAQLSNLKQPLVLFIQTLNHAVTYGYDAQKKHWFMADSNQLPITSTKKTLTVAKHMLFAMKSYALRINFLITHDEYCLIAKFYHELMATKYYQQLHRINTFKANYISINNTSLFWLAIHTKNNCLITNLLKHNPQLVKLTSHNASALRYTFSEELIDVAITLIKQGARFNHENDLYATYSFICENRRYATFKILQSFFPLKNYNMPIFGANLIHFAARGGNNDILRALIPLVEINALNNDQKTALTLAAEQGYDATCKLLLAAGAKLENGSAFVYAAGRGHLKTVQLLVQSNPNLINSINKEGWTALLSAAFYGHHDVIVELLQHQPNNCKIAYHYKREQPIDERESKCLATLVKAQDRTDNDTIIVDAIQLAWLKGHNLIARRLQRHFAKQAANLQWQFFPDHAARSHALSTLPLPIKQRNTYQIMKYQHQQNTPALN